MSVFSNENEFDVGHKQYEWLNENVANVKLDIRNIE